ncbi:MAG: L-erythro-3,5-diaminohexanoate dehydrogenase [Candidatus Lernaella stagnicola]|nr:L-erythro-3,5-diaminohexanoate dehydrogenase [Candidatus Lernaella stagnicola]
MQKHGNRYGIHRVIEPQGVVPQPAERLDNDMSEIYDNEILCDVITLNIDSASFKVILDKAGDDDEEIKRIMTQIVAKQGKHRNPWTGSGGMFIGRVARIGKALEDKIDLQVGDKIASLVSLSLTPLRIDEFVAIRRENDQVDIVGQAILFESAVWAKLPADIDEKLALAVLDVAGAPAQTAKLVKPGDTVLVIGANGKSGLLCCYEARKRAGVTGRVIGSVRREEAVAVVRDSGFVDEVIMANADDALGMLAAVEQVTDGELADVVINCVSRENCEMGSILPCKDGGLVYFFSMATSFTKAALGAEGIGKDVTMIIGNGYTRGHAAITLSLLRESDYIRRVYTERYAK